MVAMAPAVVMPNAVGNVGRFAIRGHNCGHLIALAIRGHAVLVLCTERVLYHGGRLPTTRIFLLVGRYAIIHVVVHF